jgi:hypothetical protein
VIATLFKGTPEVTTITRFYVFVKDSHCARNESIWTSGIITPLILNLASHPSQKNSWFWIEMSGQLHTLADLFLEKLPPVAIKYGGGWAPEAV